MLDLAHTNTKPLVIWRLVDGKPGHENQSLGLANAIQSLLGAQIIDIRLTCALSIFGYLFSPIWQQGQGLPKPDLILGAGHLTHLHLKKAQKIYGGKTIVLMKPSLPATWFDLCIIPEHDGYRGHAAFIETQGVLNAVTMPNLPTARNQTLIMLGGPSKHYVWNTAEVMAQVTSICEKQPQEQFVITTSRRTPLDAVHAIQQLASPHVECMPYEKTPQGWVSAQLIQSKTVWVTEDSVSMIYEAMTAGAAVGLLNLMPKQASRVVAAIARLVKHGLVVRYAAQTDLKHTNTNHVFNEAMRCAQLVVNHWFAADAEQAKTKLVVRLGDESCVK